MSESAHQLQEKWNPQEGDKYYVKHDLYMKKGKLTVVKQPRQYPWFEKEVNYVSEDGFGVLYIHQDHWDFEETLHLHSFFLPSQEWLQTALLKRLFKVDEQLFSQFNIFCMKIWVQRKHHTFNELWLMCYQYYLYNKMWNGEEWITVTEQDRWLAA
jgi:hypothetical protein